MPDQVGHDDIAGLTKNFMPGLSKNVIAGLTMKVMPGLTKNVIAGLTGNL